ncbi:MAG: hypothetical protein IPH20_21860 [Bacteroidales bacterium]|nr:hypothetical protein [Bacteroidales bacterium]
MDYLDNGITNGYDWYEVAGGRQDYMNYFHHCREVTLEISDVKLLPAAQLPAHWNYNFRSLILYMKQATYGFRGLITDQVTGNPVEAKVLLTGHDALNTEVYSTALYITQTLRISDRDYNAFTLNVQLVTGAGVSTAAVTSITATTAVSGGTVVCEGPLQVTARGVCWSTSANPTILDAHTVDGSGYGSLTSNLTGLSASSGYFVRAYVTTGSGTTYGEILHSTTNLWLNSAFPWHEGFENGGSMPDCWTQEQINSSNVNWTYISGNGPVIRLQRMVVRTMPA